MEDTFREILFVAKPLRAIPLIQRRESNRKQNKTSEMFEIHEHENSKLAENLLRKSITVRADLSSRAASNENNNKRNNQEERLVSRLIEVRQRDQVPVPAALQRAGQQSLQAAGRRRIQSMASAGNRQEAWRLFARNDGRLSVFEIVALVANLLLFSVIVVVIMKLCRKSDRSKRVNKRQLIVPMSSIALQNSSPSNKQLPVKKEKENLSAGVASASPSLQLSSLNPSPSPLSSTLPTPSPINEITTSKPPEPTTSSLVGSTREIKKEFSAPGSEQPNKATAIVQPNSKKENSGELNKRAELLEKSNRKLVASESVDGKLRASPVRLLSTGSLGSSSRVNSEDLSKEMSSTLKLNSAGSELKAAEESVVIEMAGPKEEEEEEVRRGEKKEEEKIASWISLDQKALKQSVKSVIGGEEAAGVEEGAVVEMADRKLEESPVKGQEEEAASEEETPAETDTNSLATLLFPRSTDRKYFVYIVNDTHFTPKKECIARIELPQSKKNMTLSELRQMITNSRDVGLSSIKRSKFKFVTETYRLLNENEDATFLNSIYPTQGVFLKLTAADQLLVENYSSHNNRMRANSMESKRARLHGQLPTAGERRLSRRQSIEEDVHGEASSASGLRGGVRPARALGINRKRVARVSS